MSHFWRLTTCALIVNLVVVALAAQTPPSFEVASIKLNKSGAGVTSLGFQQSGRFRAVNEPLWRLIAEAYRTTYQLERFEIFGIPDAMAGDRFDVEAVAEGNPTAAQRQAMLQRLLADRFKLMLHEEERELPSYNLVKARSDGRLGEQLRPSDVDCAALRAAGLTPPGPAATNEPRPCVMMFGQSLASARGMAIRDLAEGMLSRYVNRPVVDQTGLAGPFEWTLEWTPDASPNTQPDLSAVSIFTALQEQLGLKLESSRGRVPIFVVEHVEQPTED